MSSVSLPASNWFDIAMFPYPSLAAKNLQANVALVEAEGNLSPAYQFAKRTLDIVGSAALLVALSPILLTVLIVLAITTKGRPFFIQQRIGYLGRRFPMFKFRTMRLDAEKIQHQVQNQHSGGPIFKNRCDPRITTIGRWLR